jgi:hypothetical protein
MGLVRVERGQLVLVAAAVIAIGLAPILFAYLQLGYHPDVDDRDPEITGEKAVAFLDRSVHEAAAETAGDYAWRDRDERVRAVRADIGAGIGTLRRTRIDEGVAYNASFNRTVAEEWATENCQRGAGKRFGTCESSSGVVVQDRADEAVLLAAGFDIEAVGPGGKTELTVVIEIGGG